MCVINTHLHDSSDRSLYALLSATDLKMPPNNQVWERMARLKADVLNRICRYYHPIIAEQGVLYASQQLRLLPPDQRISKDVVERIVGMSCSTLLQRIRSPDTPTAEKAEGFSILRGFSNTFYTHGLYKLLFAASPGICIACPWHPKSLHMS